MIRWDFGLGRKQQKTSNSWQYQCPSTFPTTQPPFTRTSTHSLPVASSPFTTFPFPRTRAWKQWKLLIFAFSSTSSSNTHGWKKQRQPKAKKPPTQTPNVYWEKLPNMDDGSRVGNVCKPKRFHHWWEQGSLHTVIYDRRNARAMVLRPCRTPTILRSPILQYANPRILWYPFLCSFCLCNPSL